LNQPKHLLEVGGRPILERLLGQLAEIEQLEHVYVVTNAKFADRFREFAGSWGRSS
jgi:glucose-1-phosphate thymidylyltransferase